MNTEDRNLILNKFIEQLDSSTSHYNHPLNIDLNDLQLNKQNLPKLDMVQEVIDYHSDITSTIQNTYQEVSDVMVRMKELKNRKKNVRLAIDSMTACQQIKRLSYGLGNEPKQIAKNLERYFDMKNKVFHMSKFTERIERRIRQLQRQYQAIFDIEMSKNNSSTIAEISKILQILRTNAPQSQNSTTLQKITDLCLTTARKQFKEIEEELFKIPIKGIEESNYKFFDLAKIAMKIVANLISNYRHNIMKVSGEVGFVSVIKTLFEEATGGVILELLLRLKKYNEIDNIVVSQSKFSLKQKEFKRLQPFFKQYIAIWNQLQRLKIHLLAEISDNGEQKKELQINLDHVLTHTKLVQINTASISYMQAMMRFRIDHLLKISRFVSCVITMDGDFFRQINDKNLRDNAHVEDFLEEAMNRTCEGVEKALQTLNTLVISAIINFTNHNLIYEDIFFAFNQLFSRVFTRFPSSDTRVYQAMTLVINSISQFPKALQMLLRIKLPEEIPEKRIRIELQEVINNNNAKTQKVLNNLIIKIVETDWFRYDLSKDYEKILDKWMSLEKNAFDILVQAICRVHSQLIQETQFAKKYSQVTAINFQKQVRAKISFYQRFSHGILPHFKRLLDLIEVLQVENEEEFRDIQKRFRGSYTEQQLKRVWNLRS